MAKRSTCAQDTIFGIDNKKLLLDAYQHVWCYWNDTLQFNFFAVQILYNISLTDILQEGSAFTDFDKLS